MSLTALSATLKATLAYNIQRDATGKTAGRLTTDSSDATLGGSKAFTFGTSNGQCNQFYQDKRTLSSSATEHLNVSGGAHAGAIALLNPFGEAATFTKIKGLYVGNNSVNSIAIGGDSTDNITALFGDNPDKLNIAAGGKFVIWNDAGFAIATNEVLSVVNGAAATSEYEVGIVGNS